MIKIEDLMSNDVICLNENERLAKAKLFFIEYKFSSCFSHQ